MMGRGSGMASSPPHSDGAVGGFPIETRTGGPQNLLGRIAGEQCVVGESAGRVGAAFIGNRFGNIGSVPICLLGHEIPRGQDRLDGGRRNIASAIRSPPSIHQRDNPRVPLIITSTTEHRL